MRQLESHAEHHDVAVTRHGGHRWLMLACCIPMLLIVVALVLTGIASGSVILYALVCVAMMAVMMAMAAVTTEHDAAGRGARVSDSPTPWTATKTKGGAVP